MQDLVAPGCGPDGNPISQFVRSFAQEKSEFQQDAVHLHRDDLGPPDEDYHPLAERHHAEHRLAHRLDPEAARFFEEREHHIDRADPLHALRPHDLENAWRLERGPRAVGPEEEWAEEFQRHDHPWLREFDQAHARPPPGWAEDFARHAEQEEFERAWRQGDDPSGWVGEFKEKFRPRNEDEEEEEWYSNFQQREAQRKEESKEALLELSNKLAAIADPKLRQSNFVKFINKITNGEVVLRDNQAVEVGAGGKQRGWVEEFEANNAPPNAWTEEFRAQHAPPSGWTEEFEAREKEAWAREFAQRQSQAPKHEWVQEFEKQEGINSDDWAGEFGQREGRPTFEDWDETWGADLQANSITTLDEYHFAEDNPYKNHEQPFRRGVELLQRGQISEAIMAFEAEVQRHPDNSEAWRYLGQSHAQNDKDDRAIAALRKCVALDAHDLEALIGLGVSYTNEMYRDEALTALDKWIQFHPDYKGLALEMPTKVDEWGNEYDEQGHPVDKQDKVTELFLKAARLRPDNPDPEVQIALGLLYNLSFEYEKAVDCFALALQKRPEDYLLWNKLGATLANSNRSEEAVGVYFKALEFNPNFVRARANLGISFLALKDYPNAARHFLGALKLQPSARHIWANLRTAFSSMDRPDLLNKSMRFEVSEFAEDFDF